MKIRKIKLGQLSKNYLEDNQMKHLKGAEYYCYWGDKNLAANNNAPGGKCSCFCGNEVSYYNTDTGLKFVGDYIHSL